MSGNAGDAFLKRNDYRPDIDGLRAIAVLSVIGFHAFPALLPGGFIGVDIFFVISGFLISKHILTDLNAGTYRTTTFYARRIKRLFPALILVLCACAAMGWIILTPGEYEQLGKHIAGGAGFVSNLVYWKEAGYFDNAADTKPLLHLWSLGIEEQFYIIWPVALLVFWRMGRRFNRSLLGVLVGTVLGASLLYSLFVVRQDATADFYSPVTRFWELLLGAALAYRALMQADGNVANRTPLAWLGLGLILAAVVVIDRNDLFPGAWALLPTLGAACLIQAGEHAWPNRHLLAWRPAVWIGLISYPLYLWHWPLLSFARIMESETPSTFVRCGLVASSILLAWLSYRLVEQPIRAQGKSRKVIFMLCLAMALLFAVGLTIRKLDGVKFRQLSLLNGDPATLVLGADRSGLHHECGLSPSQIALFEYCLSDAREAPTYALLGDSKGEALFYGLARESKAGMRWMMIGSVAPPEHTAANPDQLKNQLAWQTVLHHPSIKVVAWAGALRGLFPLNQETGLIAANAASVPMQKIIAYTSAIQEMEQAGKHVVLVMDNPTFPDPRSCVSGGLTTSPMLNQFLRRKENKHCTISYTDHLAGTQAYRKFVQELQRLNPRMMIYDPTPLLCDVPHNVCTVTRQGKFLYSYGDHISDYANSLIAQDMLQKIQPLTH